MLGTRIILLGMSHQPEQATEAPQAEMLAAANFTVPAFWLLGFEPTDLRDYPVQCDENAAIPHEPGETYPLLISERESVLARTSQRLSWLKTVLSETEATLLQRWLDYLTQLNTAVLAIDTYELWLNRDDRQCLKADLKGLLTDFQTITNEASAQQALTSLQEKGVWPSNDQIALCGFGW